MKYNFCFSNEKCTGMLVVDADSYEDAREKMIVGWKAHIADHKTLYPGDKGYNGIDDSHYMSVVSIWGNFPSELTEGVRLKNGGVEYSSFLEALQNGYINEIKQDMLFFCEKKN